MYLNLRQEKAARSGERLTANSKFLFGITSELSGLP